ncbi:MAG: sugar ABC transporter permease [Proteobacteria bacterium]|nr:sugar ABC transporter permease [Pseudomonadota bacterium]
MSSPPLSRTLWIAFFVAPALALMAIFMLAPALAAFSYALYDWKAFSRGDFVGFKHFIRLAEPPYRGMFLAALGHNAITFLVKLTIQNGIALLIAYALYQRPIGARFFRGTLFLPVILSLVIVGYLWQLFLHPLFGPITLFMMDIVGLEQFAPLGDSRFALATTILMSIWRNVGFPTIVFLAGMNAIPDEIIKAARIDGANDWQIFRRIILPNLGPAFTIIVILTFIGAFEWFDLPFVIGGATGNPANSLDTMALMFFRLSFGDTSSPVTDVGLGGAVSVVLFAIVLAGSKFGADYLRKREVKA